jgi:hypothetical protein
MSPDACRQCSSNYNYHTSYWPFSGTYTVPSKIKRITEKFDDKGNLVERVVEE